jgi:hypothetical protein
MVSRNHCKKLILDKNSPFFLQRHLVYGDAREWSERRGGILSVGGDISRSEMGTATAILLEKMVSQDHRKKLILDKKSPFFLQRRLVYGDAREWRERRGEILSVDGDIPRRELGTATAI